MESEKIFAYFSGFRYIKVKISGYIINEGSESGDFNIIVTILKISSEFHLELSFWSHL